MSVPFAERALTDWLDRMARDLQEGRGGVWVLEAPSLSREGMLGALRISLTERGGVRILSTTCTPGMRSFGSLRPILSKASLPKPRLALSRRFLYTADVFAERKALYDAVLAALERAVGTQPTVLIVFRPAFLPPDTASFLKYATERTMLQRLAIVIHDDEPQSSFERTRFQELVDRVDQEGRTLVLPSTRPRPSRPNTRRGISNSESLLRRAVESMRLLAFEDAALILKACPQGARTNYLTGLCRLYLEDYHSALEAFYPLSLNIREDASLDTVEKGRVLLYLAYLSFRLEQRDKIDHYLRLFQQDVLPLLPARSEAQVEYVFFRMILDILLNRSDRLKEIQSSLSLIEGNGWDFEVSLVLGLYEYLRMIQETEGPSQAIALARRGLGIALRIGAENRVAVSSHILGVFLFAAGYPVKAGRYYRDALALRRRIQDPIELIKTLNGYGYYNFLVGRFAVAIRLFREALDYLVHKLDFQEICLTLYNISVIQIFTKRYRSALSNIESILDVMKILDIRDFPFHSPNEVLALRALCQWKLRATVHFHDSGNDSRSGLITFVKTILRASMSDIDPVTIESDFRLALSQIRQREDYLFRMFVAAEGALLFDERGEAERAQRFRALAAEYAREAGFPEVYERYVNRSEPLHEGRGAMNRFFQRSILETAKQYVALSRLQRQTFAIRFLYELQVFLFSSSDQDRIDWDHLAQVTAKNLDTVRLQLTLVREDGTRQRLATYRAPHAGEAVVHYSARSPGSNHYLILSAFKLGTVSDPEFQNLLATVVAQIESAYRLNRVNQELKEAATRDHLTKLLNRKALHSIMESETHRMQRFAGKAHGAHSLIYIDLDNFKLYNDTFGHSAGDLVLRLFADFLIAHCRSCDLAARLGGDEFLVILTETGIEGSRAWAERMLRDLEARLGFLPEVEHYTGKRHEIPPERYLSCSMGITPLDLGVDSWQNSLSRADAGLYQAKQTGKRGYVVID